jgi:hypothetical protein
MGDLYATVVAAISASEGYRSTTHLTYGYTARRRCWHHCPTGLPVGEQDKIVSRC